MYCQWCCHLRPIIKESFNSTTAAIFADQEAGPSSAGSQGQQLAASQILCCIALNFRGAICCSHVCASMDDWPVNYWRRLEADCNAAGSQRACTCCLCLINALSQCGCPCCTHMVFQVTCNSVASNISPSCTGACSSMQCTCVANVSRVFVVTHWQEWLMKRGVAVAVDSACKFTRSSRLGVFVLPDATVARVSSWCERQCGVTTLKLDVATLAPKRGQGSFEAQWLGLYSKLPVLVGLITRALSRYYVAGQMHMQSTPVPGEQHEQ
jgi:hypothetical protein